MTGRSRKSRKERAPDELADPLRYATAYHNPVLWKAVVQGLITDRNGLYVDGTLGGGGHTAALLDALSQDGRVVGIDQDEDALQAVRERLGEEIARERLLLVRGNFGELATLMEAAGIEHIDGLLLDLGVSSHQIDAPDRGFSYMAEGRLDMRMDTSAGLTAHEILNAWPEAELKQLLYTYGEEPAAARIARAIVSARPVESTARVATIIRSAVRPPDAIKTLSRVFQAIRIAVNAELDVLERVLQAATRLVRPGGRLAVISYHSLEDRRVKRILRTGNLEGALVRDFYGNPLTPWTELTRKPVEAGAEEIEVNPRSRSARLRIAERTTVTALDDDF